MRHRYGIEPETYEQMFVDQDYKCACCGKISGETKGTKLYVDHDHSTKKVRKLLCAGCNTIAGSLESDKVFNVVKYLQEHNSNSLARLELLIKEEEIKGQTRGEYRQAA